MPDSDHTMQCMEVWGGNQAVDNGVVMPGLDAWVFSEPYEKERSGGDVHYVSNCATGRITRLLIADVSGHGEVVSDVASELRTLMRRYVNYLDQTRFVEVLNREFAALEAEGRFATALAATYWAPTGVMSICNAGHPRPLWYRSKTRQWQVLCDDMADQDGDLVNLPLGVVEPARYPQFGVRMRRGDLILLYTDSLTEAMESDGVMLGEAGLLAMVGELDAERPEALTRELLQRIETYRGGMPADDDVTVLLLRNNGTRPVMTIGDRFAMAGRFVKMMFDRLRGGSIPVAWPEIRTETLGGAFFDRFNKRWGG